MQARDLLVALVFAGLAATAQAEDGASSSGADHDHGPAHAHGHTHDHGPASEHAAATDAVYPLRGIFLGYDAEAHRITVAHEAVPEVMMAMRMHLVLPEDEPVPGLAVGDKIAFELFSRVAAGRTWYARALETLPADTELALPAELREQIGH